METVLSPSILSADFTELGAEIEILKETGVRCLHLDVMDGMFVPNISFGMPVIKSVRKRTDQFLDAHLMIEDPERYIDAFAAFTALSQATGESKYREAADSALRFIQSMYDEEDKLFMTGTGDIERGASLLLEQYPQIRLLSVTAGENGSLACYQGMRCRVPVFKVPAVEKTGAGDTFCACILNEILEHGLENLQMQDLEEMLTFASAAAALVIQRKGALKVMPRREEIVELLRQHGKDVR